MSFASKTSCFARFFVKTKKWILSLKVFLLKLLLFNPCTRIWVPSHVITALWSWFTMQICGSYTLMLLVCLVVLVWNSESSKLIQHCLVLAPLVFYLNLIWRLQPLRLKILSINLIILLAALFYILHAKRVPLSRVSFFMLPKTIPSFSRRLPIWPHVLR
jgi:hypothetical protein